MVVVGDLAMGPRSRSGSPEVESGGHMDNEEAGSAFLVLLELGIKYIRIVSILCF